LQKKPKEKIVRIEGLAKVLSFSHLFGQLGEKLTRLKGSQDFFLNEKTSLFQFQLQFQGIKERLGTGRATDSNGTPIELNLRIT
jgi:hypothetical protein